MSDQDPVSPVKKGGLPKWILITVVGLFVALLAPFYVYFFTGKTGSGTDGGQTVPAAAKAVTPQEAAENKPYEEIIGIIQYEKAIAPLRDEAFKEYLKEFQGRLGDALIQKRMPNTQPDKTTLQHIESQSATDAMLRTGAIFNDYNEKIKAADLLHSVILPVFRKHIPQKDAEEIARFIASTEGKKMLEMGPQIDAMTMKRSIRYLESVAVPIRNQIADEDNWPELKTEFVNRFEEPAVPEGKKMESIQRISQKLDIPGQVRRWVAAQAVNYVNAWEASYKKELEPGTELDPADQARVDSFKKKFVERLPQSTDIQHILNVGYALQAESYTEEELEAVEEFWTSEAGSVYVSALSKIGAEVKAELAVFTGRLLDEIKKQHPVDGSKDLN